MAALRVPSAQYRVEDKCSNLVLVQIATLKQNYTADQPGIVFPHPVKSSCKLTRQVQSSSHTANALG